MTATQEKTRKKQQPQQGVAGGEGLCDCAAQEKPTRGKSPAGSRNTIQRALVLEAVRALHTHPTSADVYEAVREQHPSISRATVYRNLALLAERGDVLRVEVPNGADRYDFNIAPHHHVKCANCGCVDDVELAFEDNLLNRVKSARGFQLTGYQVIFEGLCPSCSGNR